MESPKQNRRPRLRQTLMIGGRVLGMIGLTLVALEGMLRIASGFVSDLSAEGWREYATVRILAVGDSHT